jgi:hypothetical protein
MRSLTLLFALAMLVAIAPAADRRVDDDFPRRMLYVQVANPAFLNPLTTPAPAHAREAVERLAAAFRIPTSKSNNQLFIVSDSLAPPEDRPPTQDAILKVVSRFCKTSRAQDRIVLYFSGHAFEKNNKAYFAPIEGDPDDLATMVPVAEIHDMLAACPATQKVVVWDVCRSNPEHAPIRPGAEPMSLELLLSLVQPPAGVQVVVPCLPAQSGLEATDRKGELRFPGSLLFDGICKGLEDWAGEHKPRPGDLIPIEDAFPNIEKQVAAAAKALREVQTPKIVGKPPGQITAFDREEETPAAVRVAPVKTAYLGDMKSVLQDLALPPIIFTDRPDPMPLLPFDPDTMKAYQPDVSIEEISRDVEKYPLRAVVLRSIQTIRDTMHHGGPNDGKVISSIATPLNGQLKKTVLDAQAPTAMAITRLEDELAALLGVENQRIKETKRWKAHYDYTLAQVRLRLALLNEYNLALGHVRTESLPDLPDNAPGWRLIHSDKMVSRKDVRKLADQARTSLQAIITDHKGTPWEVLARRAILTPPGLRWEPIVPK